MKSIVIFIIFAICLSNNYVSALECNGENEVFSEVVSACPPTCKRPFGPLCQALIRKPSCVCAVGTVRDTINNRCVQRKDCQKQSHSIQYEDQKLVCNGLNEKYQDWISACPAHCPKPDSPPLPETCHSIIMKPSCVCTNGTIRDTVNKRCVRPQDCPKKEAQPVLFENLLTNSYFEEKEVKCGENERPTKMISCQPTCQQKCTWTVVREPGSKVKCVCTVGFIRDSFSRKCVHLKDCPRNIGH